MKKKRILTWIVAWIIAALFFAGILAMYVGFIGLFVFALSKCLGFAFTWGLACGAALIIAAAAVFVWLVE